MTPADKLDQFQRIFSGDLFVLYIKRTCERETVENPQDSMARDSGSAKPGLSHVTRWLPTGS